MLPAAVTVSFDPLNDTHDAGSVALVVTDKANPDLAPRFIGVQVTDGQGRLPVKPSHLAIGAVQVRLSDLINVDTNANAASTLEIGRASCRERV